MKYIFPISLKILFRMISLNLNVDILQKKLYVKVNIKAYIYYIIYIMFIIYIHIYVYYIIYIYTVYEI